MGVVKIIERVVLPAGTYFVGDPCYAVPQDRWMEWLEGADYKNDPRILVAELDGHAIVGVGTAHGDGSFLGSDGNRYPVDAGMIGVVPVGAPGAVEEQAGYDEKSPIVTFDSNFEVSYEEENGTIVIGHIEIETDPEDDYPDYYDEEEDELDEEEDDYDETEANSG